ncbi:MAG: response regulator transcription factor [Chloroflexota bacterium]|nr:response regulator transcription factor [Chloroflexota bacterium]
MNRNDKITIFVVSQQFLLRQGIERSLAPAGDIEVTGTAEVSDDILSTIDALSPGVVLIDIDGPSESGLTLSRKIKQRSPDVGIILIASESDDAQLCQALEVQAAGLLNKEATAAQLINTVRRVARGEYPIYEALTARPKATEQVSHRLEEFIWRDEGKALISRLTQRETGILSYIAQGYLNKQIAIELGISEQTIKNHVTSILRKLHANARTEAVVIGIKRGLISIS